MSTNTLYTGRLLSASFRYSKHDLAIQAELSIQQIADGAAVHLLFSNVRDIALSIGNVDEMVNAIVYVDDVSDSQLEQISVAVKDAESSVIRFMAEAFRVASA